MGVCGPSLASIFGFAVTLAIAGSTEALWKVPLIDVQHLGNTIRTTDSSDNITATATITTHDITLVAKNHENASVILYLSGDLKVCVNLTFTYDPNDPTIDPLDGFTLCPQDGDSEERSSREHAVALSPNPLPKNFTLEITSRRVGKTVLGLKAEPAVFDVTNAFIRVAVIHDPVLDLVSDVFGWTYSIIWDISFLPQVWLNWNRKSVVGFSLDNVTLNILAYLCYSLFNVAFFAVPFIQNQFHERYPRQVNHVRPNDVFFACYALFIEIVLGIQCLIYHREPGQVVSKTCWVIVTGSVLSVAIACVLAAEHVLWWLDVFYLMSYLKLGITPLKYIPQLYVNYRHKSTAGFSMVGLLMDFTGGALSLAQMFMLSANNDDWISVFNNFSKFGLGVITILFDLMFFFQHYYFHLRKKPLVI
ncbi:cystinosin-like [Penaeus japonicus]|uniref:cystinosin-like n=1 Tax=Penaeus japonicus TaxID=27405 RepID=UPI001C714EA5|nr:cystinosin-like [Penaeus japonicus]